MIDGMTAFTRVAVLVLISTLADAQAQLPAGRLEFRTASAEFRQDGTFTTELLMEGLGTLRVAGEWKADPTEITFSGSKVEASTGLLEMAGTPADGCER